jgi:hypothetical protein
MKAHAAVTEGSAPEPRPVDSRSMTGEGWSRWGRARPAPRISRSSSAAAPKPTRSAG